jgi:adenylyltransferase/sulfurtransferase
MFRLITPIELNDSIEKGENITLVDVRESHEHDYCRIEGSLLCPLSGFPQNFLDLNLDSNNKIVFYCHHGVRSANAANALLETAYTDLWSLVGGIEAWSLMVDPSVPRY